MNSETLLCQVLRSEHRGDRCVGGKLVHCMCWDRNELAPDKISVLTTAGVREQGVEEDIWA